VNVLFLTHRLPYAPNRGDRIRAHFLLRVLSAKATIRVVSLVHDEAEASHMGDLAPFASSTHIARVNGLRNRVRSVLAMPGQRPTTHTMLDSPELDAAIAAATREQPDVVLAYCSGMARLAMSGSLRSYPCVLDMVDVDSEKWKALAAVSSAPLSWVYRREARVLRQFEADATAFASSTMVVTTRERDSLCEISPTAHIEVVPNGVDVEGLRPTSAPLASTEVVFCGVMNYAPNERAARLLVEDVWPLVRTRRPDATLSLVGSNPTRAVEAFASVRAGISVTGSVPDVRPYLWKAAIAVAPIVTARGIQNKVLEAVAAGLPTIVTPNIMDSLPDEIRPACVSADSPQAIADAIVAQLNRSPAERRATAERASVGSIGWEHQLAPVSTLLEQAIQAGPSRRIR
jgi:sugar transferase (PEP-CTERM/EpsH1 system associated)